MNIAQGLPDGVYAGQKISHCPTRPDGSPDKNGKWLFKPWTELSYPKYLDKYPETKKFYLRILIGLDNE